ncbi:MAG: carbohydrate kinase [Clostridiales bacterium]|nr:carbohydrate kinase [Clostridiales bacterium]
MRYYLGLDNGGTATKAALFTPGGTQVGTASAATAALTPAPGFVERDMDEMWRDNCAVIRSLLQKTGVSPKDIAGIGLCGHGKGLYLWGRDDRPVRRGILSADNRAWKYQMDWKADGTEAAAFALSCQHIMACQPVCLLAWLRDHEPGTLERTRWIFACKDYVRFRLTGEARAEITDYSGTGLINLRTGAFDPALLKLFGLEGIREALPPLCQSAEICGRITEEAAAQCGLAAGTPVIGGMFDIDACALAVGVTDETNLCMIAGTWSINEYLRREPVTDGRVLMNSLFCLPGYYLIEESSPTSAGNNEWFVRQLLPELTAQAESSGRSVYDIMNQWAEEFSPRDFVPVFLPFLTASNVDPRARSAFVGLNASHTRKHLLRAVYEGIAFSHRWHLERLLATRPGSGGHIRLAGGAARSRVWTQIFADVMGIPVETVSAGETGALGCAVAVASAVGDFSSVDEAAAHMCALAPAVEPDPPAREAYDKKYALYCRTIHCLDGLWPEMQDYLDWSAGQN